MKFSFSFILFSILIYSFNCSFQSTLFKKMNEKKIGENLIISPLSIFQVLSLAANGAKGETLSQMLELLQIENLEELNKINIDAIELFKRFKTIDIANAVMTRFTPVKAFVDITKKYLAPIEPLLSAGQVNKWVSDKTHGKIDKIIDFLSPDTLMILINAVYFKGEWENQFNKRTTKPLPFYNFGKEKIEVDTMSQTEHFKYYQDKNVKAISLKFVLDFMSALIILPAKGTDINEYINTLADSNEEYTKIIEGLKQAKVKLQLPKFEVKFSQNLNEILQELGMTDAFIGGKADFSGIRKEEDLFVSRVIHKTYLKVNEEGTEAAAATGLLMRNGMGPRFKEKIYNMKVNRPFLFLLRNSDLPAGHDLIFMSKIEKLE